MRKNQKMDLMMKRLERIGTGTYSKVYNILDPQDKNPNGNVLKRNFASPNIDYCSNLRELDILAMLKDHPFVISLDKVCFGNPFRPEQPLTPPRNNESKDDQMHFILEKMVMSLKPFIRETERYEGYFTQINILTCQLLLAVEYMHAHGITHRDLKPDNILLGDDESQSDICGIYLKLADFGMSKPLSPNFPSTPGCVTSWYRAPEIVMGVQYSHMSDMWSVGCILYEMISGESLIKTDTDKDSIIFRDIMAVMPNDVIMDESEWKGVEPIKAVYVRELTRMSFKERSKITTREEDWFDKIATNNTNMYFDVIKSLLVINPDNRLSATKALDMPFFESTRNYINSVRSEYPIVKDTHKITIVDCPERKWMASIVADIVNHSDKHLWYSHRIIFHSISMFDRFLEWADNGGMKHNTKISASVGLFLQSKLAALYYYVCLYLSYKYFLSINSCNFSWKEFVNSSYSTEKMCDNAKSIEVDLIEDVFKYRIYHKNIVEIPEHLGLKLDNTLLTSLLEAYLSSEPISCVSVTDLYHKFTGSQNIHNEK
jgi:serine/threonine protein kinase